MSDSMRVAGRRARQPGPAAPADAQQRESTSHIWRLPTAACALELESGEIGVYPALREPTQHP